MQQEKIISHSARAWIIGSGVLLFVIVRAVTTLVVRFAPEQTMQNVGIAFSFPMPATVTLVVSVVLILGIYAGMCWAFFTGRLWHTSAFIVLAVGATSNYIDRIRYGGVVDYIQLPILSIINVADILITIGVSMLALTLLRNAHTYDRTTQDRSNRRN